MTSVPSLKTLFRANALFSIACAIDALVFTQYFAQWMGITQPIYLQLLGVGLVLFAGYVIWVSARPAISKPLALQIIAADLSWVVGTVLLLTLNPFGFTMIGQTIVLVIGMIVLAFAVLQIKATKRQCDVVV
jgi:hypothetical protein